MSRAVAALNTTAYNAEWKVPQLREAAKNAGISGYAGMTKAQLLEALNGGEAWTLKK